jgi:hypothetical protein
MSNEPNDPIFVDPNTDDLDSFNDLFTGKAKVKEDEVEIDDVEPVDEDDDTDVDTQDTDTDEAPDGDDDSDDSEPEEKPKPKKVNRFQERINELTAKAREAERSLEALRAEQAQKQAEPTKQATPVVQDLGPDPDAKNEDGSDKYPLGEFDPSYIRDMARHTIDKEWTARKEQETAEQNQRQIEAARAEIQNQWVEKLTPMTEQHEDFLDKTMELESAFDGLDPQYSDYLVQTIKSLDHGPEVLYYFANHLDEAQKFVRMGPLNATLALGEINAMFKGNTRKETKVSKAPPPPQVNKGSKTRVAVTPDTDDLDAFSNLFFEKKRR